MVQLGSMSDSALHDLLHITNDILLTVDKIFHMQRLKVETVGDIRLQMENEWSMDFAFPLLSLLKATGSEVAAYNRAKEICR